MWTINGVDPRTTYGLRVEGAPGWENAPATTFPMNQIPGRPGNILLSPDEVIPARKIVVTGVVVGTSNADMLTKLDGLKGLLNEPSLQVIMNNRNTRYITARLDGELVVTPGDASMISRMVPVAFTLMADDPWWYDVTPQHIGMGGPMPMGTAPVWPVANVTFSGNMAQYDHVLWGYPGGGAGGALVSSISVTNNFVNGDVLMVDHWNKLVTINGVPHLDKVTVGDFFKLDHRYYRQGAYSQVTGSGAPALGFLDYRRAWR